MYYLTGKVMTVPDRRCRILRVVLVRRWQPGFWEFGGGRVGERVEKGEVS
jgi:8-oxo-dGTP pyrophosphatase MutT (NUDIX family)